jgi:hypothetical protein
MPDFALSQRIGPAVFGIATGKWCVATEGAVTDAQELSGPARADPRVDPNDMAVAELAVRGTRRSWPIAFTDVAADRVRVDDAADVAARRDENVALYKCAKH